MIRQIAAAVASEYRLIFQNRGVMLVLLFAPLIYTILYSSAYAKQIATEVPIAIIDHSQSHSSRELISMFGASPYIDIRYQPTDMQEAKSLFMNGDIYGIVYIPNNYDRCAARNEQRWISLYLDASYFLMYRQVFAGVAGTVSSIHNVTPAIELRSHTLYNPALGYGTFIMPAVLLVILQQTALMGIGMVGALQRRLRYKPMVAIASKTPVYSTIYAVLCSYIFVIHYRIFGYPESGEIWRVVVVIISYMLAVIMLASALSTLFRRVEEPLIYIIWSSIPVLLLSGASLPVEAFPQWMHTIGLLLPSSSAVPAFVRVQSMGATLTEVAPELVRLWVLTLLYTALYINKVSERFSSLGYPLPPKGDIHTLL